MILSCFHFLSSVGLYADTVVKDTENRPRRRNGFIPPDDRGWKMRKVWEENPVCFFLFGSVSSFPFSPPVLAVSPFKVLCVSFLSVSDFPPPSFSHLLSSQEKGFLKRLCQHRCQALQWLPN